MISHVDTKYSLVLVMLGECYDAICIARALVFS